MTEKTLTPAAAYVRMSTDTQQDSPARQRADITALAEREGFRVVWWYEDHGKTGTESKKRTDFQKLLTDAKAGRFAAVLMSEQSRMSREDLFDVIGHWKLLRDAGVVVVTCQRGRMDFDTLGGLLTSIVDAHGAHDESRKIAERTTSGKRNAIAQGRRQGGPVFGYDREIRNAAGGVLRRVSFRERFIKPPGHTAHLVPSAEAEAVEAVQFAFAGVRDGMTPAQIAAALNARGIRTTFGKVFISGEVSRLLRNPVYCGVLRVGFRTGETRFKSIFDAPRLITGAHPGLVSREEFDAVQTVLKARFRKRGRGTPGRYLLQGVAWCGHCGLKMHGSIGGTKVRRPMYVCGWTPRKPSPVPCPHPAVNATSIEQHIVGLIRERLLSRENRERIADRVAARSRVAGARTDPAEQRLAVLQADITQGERNLARAKTDADYAAVSRSLSEWREEAEAIRAKLRAAVATKAVVTGDAAEVVRRLEWLCKNFHKAPRPVLADRLKQVVRRVEVRHADIGENAKGGRLRAFVGTVHFVPDLYPDPVPLRSEELVRANPFTRSDSFTRMVDFIKAAGRPVRPSELVSLGLHWNTVYRGMLAAERLGIVERLGSTDNHSTRFLHTSA